MKNLKKQELIFGIHPILELLKAKKRKLITLYTTKPEPKSWKQIQAIWPKYPVNLQYVSRDVLHKIAETTDHQGIVAYVGPMPTRNTIFQSTTHPRLIMLDGIQDPRNLGAIIRSAYCTGFDGVILCARGSAPLNATAIKASAGLAEHVDFYIAPSAKAATQELHKAGYQLYLTTLTKGADATTVTYQEPLCIVIGNEESGISKEIFDAGIRITLPQRSSDISYNASVAAGIFMFLIMSKK